SGRVPARGHDRAPISTVARWPRAGALPGCGRRRLSLAGHVARDADRYVGAAGPRARHHIPRSAGRARLADRSNVRRPRPTGLGDVPAVQRFFELAADFPSVTFVAVGAASDPNRDAELRRTYGGLANVQMTGVLDQFESDAPFRVFEASWVLINTSAREG